MAGEPAATRPRRWRRSELEREVLAAEHEVTFRQVDKAAVRLNGLPFSFLKGSSKALGLRLRIAQHKGVRDLQDLISPLVAAALDDLDAAMQLGAAAGERGAHAEAVTWFRIAHRQAPDEAHPLIGLAHALRKCGRRNEAAERLREIKPQGRLGALAQVGLADLLSEDGERDKAVERFRAALSIDGSFLPALSGLISTGEVDQDDELLARAETAAGGPQPAQMRVPLSYSLAKAFDRRGEYDRAFAHAERANSIARSAHPYDGAAEEARARRLIDLADDKEFLARLSKVGTDRIAPIFVIGMPRSGTTLIEQVLATHPRVQGLGELVLFDGVFQALTAGELRPRAVRDVQLASLASAYEAAANKVSSELIVDKFPGNIRYVPFIGSIFPRAKFVHCVRDDRDNAVSIFMEEFTPTGTFATSFEGIHHAQELQRGLIENWRQRLPDRIHEARYEEVVAEPEQSLRALFGSVDLEWTPECLRFFETRRTVATPSKNQVRRPIYSTSVGRWRNYAQKLPSSFAEWTGEY